MTELTKVEFIDKVGELHIVPHYRYRTIVDKEMNDNEVTYGENIVDDTGYIPLDKQIKRFLPDMNYIDEDCQYVDEDTDDVDSIDIANSDDLLDNASLYNEILSPDAKTSEQQGNNASEPSNAAVGNNSIVNEKKDVDNKESVDVE